MTADVECPECGAAIEINHDDGFGYSEDTLHKMECPECDKTFGFTTSISFYYEPQKIPCANGGQHKYEPTFTVPVERTRMSCIHCDGERAPTSDEMTEIIAAWNRRTQGGQK